MKSRISGKAVRIAAILLALVMLAGCSRNMIEEENEDKLLADNVLITETGEVIEKDSLDEEADADGTAKEGMQQENNEELPENDSQGISDLPDIVVPEPEQIITEEDQTEPAGNDLQLVFLGDSIFDSNRDGTGIPYLTAVQCEADVFNLAVGGTCASLQAEESTKPEEFSSWSLVEMVNVLMGTIPASHFSGTRAGEILSKSDIDFSQTDYFIVEYGTNDFLNGNRRSTEDGFYDLRSYTGALRYAVANLTDIAPDATVILCSPCFAQFYGKDGYLVGDGNMTDKGQGTLFDYKGTCNYVAKEQNCLFLNAYEDLGVDAYTADEYLEDGIHFTAEGRELYADALARMILKYEETKNN